VVQLVPFLDKYFEDHLELKQLRDRNFILLKVNYSPENENEPLLSRYPKIPGYPHFFILETDGKLLLSQGTSELEEGKSYNLKRFTDFLQKWSPPASKARQWNVIQQSAQQVQQSNGEQSAVNGQPRRRCAPPRLPLIIDC